MQTAGDVDRQWLADSCRRRGIRKLAVFGSVLREDFGLERDVDVLVSFEPGRFVGFSIFEMEAELSQAFGGRRVDLVSDEGSEPTIARAHPCRRRGLG